MKIIPTFLIFAALLFLVWGQQARAEINPHYGPSVVAADMDAGEEIHEGAGHEGEHKKTSGLPQLDPSSYPSQVFWLIVSFILLYTVFSKSVLPDIGDTLDTRRKNIENDIGEAQKFNDRADFFQKAYDSTLLEARTHATSIFQENENALKLQASKQIEAFNEKSAAALKSAETALASAKVGAMEQMHQTAAELASTAAEKIIGIPANLDEARNVVKNIGKKAA